MIELLQVISTLYLCGPLLTILLAHYRSSSPSMRGGISIQKIKTLVKTNWIQEFPHFFETNAVTLTAKWEAAKQRASEPPLLSHLRVARASMKMWCSLTQNTAINGANCSLRSSLPLGLVRAIFTYQSTYNLTDYINLQPSNKTFWGNSCNWIRAIDWTPRASVFPVIYLPGGESFFIQASCSYKC
jgi:hypothetical protein